MGAIGATVTASGITAVFHTDHSAKKVPFPRRPTPSKPDLPTAASRRQNDDRTFKRTGGNASGAETGDGLGTSDSVLACVRSEFLRAVLSGSTASSRPFCSLLFYSEAGGPVRLGRQNGPSAAFK